jgi:hypothetical protein
VSLAGSLRDLQSLDRGLDLRIKPYVTGAAATPRQSGVGDTATATSGST